MHKKILNISSFITSMFIIIFIIIIAAMPNLVIKSAKEGLLLWFNNIIPSILPFLICTNLLIKLGIADFLGGILEPFMQKIFNINGKGVFALVMGMLSGYPIGAKITCDLKNDNKINNIEAQRLISFSNNCSPIFIIATVGVLMFKSAKIGYLILIIHYLSAFTVGILFRFYKKDKSKDTKIYTKKSLALCIKERKTFGEILSDSVKNSLETICIIGGFVILFCVIAQVLAYFNIFFYIGKLIFKEDFAYISNGLFLGIIEITNGLNILKETPTKEVIAISCGLISFSGLSILFQTSSIIYNTDIKFSLYILAKCLHAFIAIFYAVLCFPIIDVFLKQI